MKVVNGTVLRGPGGLVAVRHGEPVETVSVLESSPGSEVPFINWYWATEAVTVLWQPCRGVTAMLRIPPEQTICASMHGRMNMMRAGDLDLSAELMLPGGNIVPLAGLRADRAQISMANIVFSRKGAVFTEHGALLGT